MEGPDLAGNPGTAGEGRDALAVPEVVEEHRRRLQPRRQEQGIQSQRIGRTKYRCSRHLFRLKT